MGLLDKVFGNKPDYPELDPEEQLAQQVKNLRQPLENLMDQVKDPMEIVPAQERTYVIIGKPPKKFGVAWIEGTDVENFQKRAQEAGIGAGQMEEISDKLRSAYEKYENSERYVTNVADRKIVVTPSKDLSSDIHDIVSQVVQ
jgi:hypothetical protein